MRGVSMDALMYVSCFGGGAVEGREGGSQWVGQGWKQQSSQPELGDF